jgi:hypothetical protein
MPAISGYPLICLKKLAVPPSSIDVVKARKNRFLNSVMPRVFMALKLFAPRGKEKRIPIRKELEPFADLLEKDKKGNLQLRLTKEAEETSLKMLMVAAVKRMDIEEELGKIKRHEKLMDLPVVPGTVENIRNQLEGIRADIMAHEALFVQTSWWKSVAVPTGITVGVIGGLCGLCFFRLAQVPTSVAYVLPIIAISVTAGIAGLSSSVYKESCLNFVKHLKTLAPKIRERITRNEEHEASANFERGLGNFSEDMEKESKQ